MNSWIFASTATNGIASGMGQHPGVSKSRESIEIESNRKSSCDERKKQVPSLRHFKIPAVHPTMCVLSMAKRIFLVSLFFLVTVFCRAQRQASQSPAQTPEP